VVIGTYASFGIAVLNITRKSYVALIYNVIMILECCSRAVMYVSGPVEGLSGTP
jgi:hypothetical protein